MELYVVFNVLKNRVYCWESCEFRNRFVCIPQIIKNFCENFITKLNWTFEKKKNHLKSF